MKKTLIYAAAIFIAAAALAGCTMFDAINKGAGTPAPTSPGGPARGAAADGVYTNADLGLVFTAPEGWRFYTDQEIAGMAGAGDTIKGYTCDMYAADAASGSCAAIEYQDLAAVTGGMDLDEEKYLDMYKEETGKKGSFEFGGYEDIKIGANVYRAVAVTAANDNLIKYYCVRRSGNYMTGITLIIPKDSGIGSLTACFS